MTWLGIAKFRGNRAIGLMWGATWALLLLAAANVDPRETPYFYKSLILFAPIALTISALAYFDWPHLDEPPSENLSGNLSKTLSKKRCFRFL